MTDALPPRIRLSLSPTPLEYADRLSTAWGGPRIWIKRDDLTGFELSGNKVRKLEFHLAAARDAGADTVITCGAMQSNHSRATALAAARLGLRTILLLRRDPDTAAPLTGNYLLDRLAGADVRFITPQEWDRREAAMQDVAELEAAAGRRCWVIPEGASDALGMWGFVLALREIADQAAAISGSVPIIWHAASSGGTTAGIGWGLDRLSLTFPVVACSIGDSAAEIEAKVAAIWEDAAVSVGAKLPTVSIDYNDRHTGGGYGMVSVEELAVQAEATSLTGLLFDPTYTGKALVGLKREIDAGTYSGSDNVIFWHTGGGFAVFAHDFSQIAAAADPGVQTA